MQDTYYNLTRKVFFGFSWAAKHCPRFDFLVKVDADVIMNPFALIDYLVEHNLLGDSDIEFLGKSSIFCFVKPMTNTLTLAIKPFYQMKKKKNVSSLCLAQVSMHSCMCAVFFI